MNKQYEIVSEVIKLNEGVISTIRRGANKMGNRLGEYVGKIAAKKGMTPEEARNSFKTGTKLAHNQKWNSYQKGFYNSVKRGF